MQTIIIIGNGISGVTAARHIRKRSDDRIIIISKETKYFFSRTALMYIYMGHMKFEHTQPFEPHFWKKNKIELLQDEVSDIDFDNQKLHLKQDENGLSYDKLILAVGSSPNKFGWPGQDLEGVHGMYSAQDLQRLEERSKDIEQAVVVGGGMIGIELCEMLMSRGKAVTFLVREPSFWSPVLPPEESALVTRHIETHHLDLRLATELKEVLANDKGAARAVVTNTGDEIEAQFVGLTVGVSPNIRFLKETKLETQRGIMINEYFETNIENVYAIGDCAQHRVPLPNRRPVEQVWYTGRLMGETLAKNLVEKGVKKAYEPGPWFNSAKFFDIEYQTYGMVYSQLQEGEVQFCWEHPDGQKLLKIVFDEASGEFKGVNTFGIRLRHDYFDPLLRRKASVKEVMSRLAEANFDPEFFKKHEADIVVAFNKAYPKYSVSVPKASLFF